MPPPLETSGAPARGTPAAQEDSRPLALAVDDEPAVRGFLAEALRPCCRVVTAASGEEALDAAAQEEPALILLDLGLPGIDGLETLRRLRRLRPRAAVVVVTGRGSEEAASSCMREGAVDFLVKPFDLGRLRDAVDHALERRERRIARGLEEERLRRERGELTEARATLEETVRARTGELEEATRELAAVNLRLQERNRALVTLERSYEELFDLAADGLLKLDGEGRIHLANRRAQLLTGASLVDLRGKEAAALLPEEARARFRLGLARVATGAEESFRLETAIRAGADPPVPVELRLAPLAGEEGARGLELALEDITERRLDEARLKDLEERAIVAGMSRHLSHVLLNALTSAGGHLGRLRPAPALAEEEREHLRVAIADLGRMEQVVRGYQDYVAVTRARPAERHDCGELLREAVRAGESAPLEGGLRFGTIRIEPDPAPALIDPVVFRLGLDYLWRGIAHASAAAGGGPAALELHGSRVGEEYRIRLLLPGVHFAAGILQTIDRPWRHQVLHRSFDRWDLAIAETMAERHGGRLGVQDLPEGTEILVRLPCLAP